MSLCPTIMVQGTQSSVGKSLMVTALCRILHEQGLKVAPFKAQNMALNAYVCAGGEEIGRAQAVQAMACGLAPNADMNPILLKPESERRSQVVVSGRVLASMDAAAYHELKPRLRERVLASLQSLRAAYDVVVIEGAGSPAEVNLKDHDLVNMFVAKSVASRVLLLGDIDRGGIFASLLGTLDLLHEEERALVHGLIVNKFRGDLGLFKSGIDFIAERSGKPVLGVIPYLHKHRIPDEDSLGLADKKRLGPRAAHNINIAIVRLPRLSNYDEFQALEHEPGVAVRYVEDALGASPDDDLLILPGTKSTLADLSWLRASGLAEVIMQRARAGQAVLGICGGCQMLGGPINDPYRIEGGEVYGHGLGLLPLVTNFSGTKLTAQVEAKLMRSSWLGLLPEDEQQVVHGYEIHAGMVTGTVGAQGSGLFQLTRRGSERLAVPDGARDAQGAVLGTLIHGLFDNHWLRRRVLMSLARRKGQDLAASAPGEDERGDADFSRLAAHFRQHLDMVQIMAMLH